MMTYEEIEKRRAELEHELTEKPDYTEELMKEWWKLYDAEMELNMENAIASARNGNDLVFFNDAGEIGYAMYMKKNGEWDYEECHTAVHAMKLFKKTAKEIKAKKCLVTTNWLDAKHVEEIDRQRAEYERQERYSDACMASAYGDDSLMKRYEDGVEADYGPSNPWDAPGMSVRDFI